MPLHLIIDGYNLLGHLEGFSKNLRDQRTRLLSLLSGYGKSKKFSVCVVFDGWKEGTLSQHYEIQNGVEVIYSRLGEKADLVICRLIKSLKEKCVVVSSDREIIQCAEQNRSVAITVAEFEKKLLSNRDSDFVELSDDDSDESASRNSGGKKSGNPRKLSKKKREKQNKLRKL
ncbi:MAG TPA: NYN domain-containing protein [Nitrospiria bacterium]|nr:NYN domain-containing protein [Nitrospiria bacterium]